MRGKIFGFEPLPVDALQTVGIVFAEALALYVLYGAVTELLGRRMLAAVGGK